MKKRNRREGFVLVTTLLFLVVTLMMLSAAYALLPASRLMSGSVDSHEQALQAAEAGIEYAKTRLQENPAWRGDADAITIDQPGDIWVREADGNVVGILWSSNGEPSLFKIRFNYQNGSGGGSSDEDFDDPPSDMIVESVFVSHNNLNGDTSQPQYRADSSGYSVDDTIAPVDVPKYSAVVYCDGFAGDGVRDASPTQLSTDPESGAISTATLEVVLGRDASKYGDSVLYGARDILINISNELIVESSDTATPPRARSMGNIAVSGGGSDPVDWDNGEAYVKPGDGTFTVNSLDSSDPAATRADSSGEFLQLGWDEIDKASSSDPRLPAGTYVWRTGGSLDYYAQEYDPVAGPPTGTPDATYNSTADLPSSTSGAVELNPARIKMSFTENVLVEPAGSASGLAIVSEPGLIPALQRRPEAELDAPTPDDPSPILTATGPIYLQGRIRGDGSITSEGDITFQGESVIEAKSDNKVAIYSKQDINIEAIPADIIPNIIPAGGGAIPGPGPAPSSSPGGGGIIDFFEGALPPFGVPHPTDVAFGGVIYAQGNFNINLGTSSNFHLHGVMVAYGGDSAAGEMPGDRSGAGYVNVNAKNAQLQYDSSYVANLLDQNGATKLDVVSWHRRR